MLQGVTREILPKVTPFATLRLFWKSLALLLLCLVWSGHENMGWNLLP